MTLNRKVGVLTLRLLLGFIFFFQGYGKVFNMKVSNVYNDFFKKTYEELLPDFLLQFTAYYTSYVELIGGFLLIIGLTRDWALYALASVLVIVTFGHGMAAPIWDASHVMVRALFLIPLLLLPREWDVFSLDTLIRDRK